MKISVTLPEGIDLKQHLLNKDLLKEQFTDDDLPLFLATYLNLINNSKYQWPVFDFRADIYYSVIVVDVPISNYVFLHFSELKNPSEWEKQSQRRNEMFIEWRKTFPACAEKFQPIKTLSVGDPVAAKWSTDGEWYRAIVTEVQDPKKQCTIAFVDYGNSDVVDVDSLRVLPLEHTEKPPIHAFLARISNVRPKNNGIWTPYLNKSIKDALLTENDEFLALFKSFSQPFEISLHNFDGTNIRKPKDHALQRLIHENHLQLL